MKTSSSLKKGPAASRLKRKKQGQPKLTNPKPRSYDNTLRVQKRIVLQKQIIEALVELLVERKGGDVTFDEVAKKSKVPVRTIYRFFEDKEALHLAMDNYLFTYLEASNDLLKKMDVAEFGRSSYEIMDRHENLVLAYLYSPFGRNARVLFRKKLNAALVYKILEQKKIPLTPENQTKLAVIVSLVNAKIWHDIKQDTGLKGAEIGPSIEWALRTLIGAL